MNTITKIVNFFNYNKTKCSGLILETYNESKQYLVDEALLEVLKHIIIENFRDIFYYHINLDNELLVDKVVYDIVDNHRNISLFFEGHNKCMIDRIINFKLYGSPMTDGFMDIMIYGIKFFAHTINKIFKISKEKIKNGEDPDPYLLYLNFLDAERKIKGRPYLMEINFYEEDIDKIISTHKKNDGF